MPRRSALAPNETPGRLAGELSVSPEGEAHYTVPLWIPPGRAGVQPSLALAYSSGRGNGQLGVGWSLSGLSEITRCRKTLGEDGAHRAIRFDARGPLLPGRHAARVARGR